MTYETDPIRWTENPDFAPAGLSDPLRAASSEGPSNAQMRTLALKLAAISAGGAIAASAATAKASTAAAGGVAASSLPIAKLLVTAAVVSVTAISGAFFYQTHAPSTPTSSLERAPQATPAATANAITPAQEVQVAEQPGASREHMPGNEAAAQPTVEPLKAPHEASEPSTVRKPRETRVPVGSERVTVKESRPGDVVASRKAAQAKNSAERTAETKSAAASEVELLRRARAALTSSPRESFALTEAHRENYPTGVFAQERDALAIEALMRAGDMTSARRLAERFVRAHPSSPHAHRFRETMGLR